MTVLILLRHGRTEYNTSGRLQGRLDVPLGERGRDDARAAAAALLSDYGRPDRILASPLARAADTAAELASLTGVDVEPEPRITQRSYGVWEGLTLDEVRERWPDDLDRRAAGLDPRIDGWEGAAPVASRVRAALEEACAGASLVVAVSHGSAIQLGALALLGLDLHGATLGKLPHAHWHVLKTEGDRWSLARAGMRAPAD